MARLQTRGDPGIGIVRVNVQNRFFRSGHDDELEAVQTVVLEIAAERLPRNSGEKGGQVDRKIKLMYG